MNIETTEWVANSEAARLLSMTPQRVSKLGHDGALDVIRPWPHVTLVGRRSLAAWLAGERLPRIGRANAQRYLLKRGGVTDTTLIDIDDMRDWLLDFITEARPRWEQARRERWALNLASEAWLTGRDPELTLTS